MADNLKYEDKRETITEMLNTQKLPTVVRIYDNGTKTDECRDVDLSRISGNTQVMLQARIKVKYGHIKILNYYDNHAMEQEKGCEYVLEHDTFVDEEFLVPLKYNGKIKFAHRPGRRRRYASVGQVLSELPRYLRVDEDTVAVPSNGIGKNVIIPANTTLEVVRKFTQPHGNITYLECCDGKTSYVFGEKDRINCTEVDDSKLYDLVELIRCKMLPKVLMFQDVATEDAILMDHYLNSVMLTIVDGPVELLGFDDIDVLVGWVRDKERKTYKTVLIPRGLWNTMAVQRRNLRGEEEKINYIKRKYGHCNDIDFIEKSLYLMSMNQCDVTWLRSPAFYKANFDGKSLYQPVPITFQDSSSCSSDDADDAAADDDDDETLVNDYEEIKVPVPPVPERHPIPRGDLQQQTVLLPTVKRHIHETVLTEALTNEGVGEIYLKDITHVIQKMLQKKSLFHRVHSELMGLFIRKDTPQMDAGEQNAPEIPRRPSESVRRASKQHNVGTETNTTTDTQVTRTHARTTTDTILSPHDIVCSDDDVFQYRPLLETADSENVPEYDYPDCTDFSRDVPQNRPLPKFPDATTTGKSRDLESHRSRGRHAPVSPMQHLPPSPARPSPRTPGIHESTSPQVPSSPTAQPVNTLPTVTNQEGPKYVSLSMEKIEHLFRADLTKDDFFQYTVIETAHCFKHCGLKQLADICRENILDGSFFKGFDLEELKKDPFNLTRFCVLKVRKMIYEGWRPKVCR